MKYPLLLGLPIAFVMQTNNDFSVMTEHPATTSTVSSNENNEPMQIGAQDANSGRMRSIVFKNQEYCRVELKDFVFDVEFKIVGATVYFSGANFKDVVKKTISSNSLKPISDEMKRCIPGTIVVFDEVKVKGPDNEIRTIPGATYMLY